MLNKFITGFIPVASVTLCLAAGFIRSTPLDQKTPRETVPASGPGSYIGTAGCITCHRKQAGAWSETKHAEAFEHLPAKYRNDSSCLKCHLTGFGEPGGYAPGMTAEEAQPFLSVGCEACHGPGAAHAAAVERWTLSEPADEEKLLKEMKEAILKTPNVSQCTTCHTTQGHQPHPPYDGQPLRKTVGGHRNVHSTTAAMVSSPPSQQSYSVKTCGSCHYEQYKQWRVETHSALTTGLPANYTNDTECLKCHRKSNDSWYTATTNPHANFSQVGCESCHGSALKHVLFNKQFISGPRLGPELELAARESIRKEKPAATCVQCHVREGHQEHPEYEEPVVNKTD